MTKLFESPEYQELEKYMPNVEAKHRFMHFILDIISQAKTEANLEFNRELKKVKP